MVVVKEVSPVESFMRIYRRWWWITALAILGGVLGWVFHKMQPPVYEARASMGVNIDFAQSGPLTEYEQDYSIGMVQAVAISQDVLGQLALAAEAEGIPVSDLYYGRRIFLERRQYLIDFRVLNPDAEIAARISNLWAIEAEKALQEAYANTLDAQGLRTYLNNLQLCLAPDAPPPGPNSLCSKGTLEEIRAEVNSLSGEVEAEAKASRGLVPALYFSGIEPAKVPNEPAAFGANMLVFAGLLLGFCLGILLATTLPERS